MNMAARAYARVVGAIFLRSVLRPYVVRQGLSAFGGSEADTTRIKWGWSTLDGARGMESHHRRTADEKNHVEKFEGDALSADCAPCMIVPQANGLWRGIPFLKSRQVLSHPHVPSTYSRIYYYASSSYCGKRSNKKRRTRTGTTNVTRVPTNPLSKRSMY